VTAFLLLAKFRHKSETQNTKNPKKSNFEGFSSQEVREKKARQLCIFVYSVSLCSQKYSKDAKDLHFISG
jgi:hypothetical protein